MTGRIGLTAVVLGLAWVAPSQGASTDQVAATEWRVFSEMFSTLPRDGYPIHFHPGGIVETTNLALVAGWELSAGELELCAEDGRELLLFRSFPEERLWISCPQWRRSALPNGVISLGTTVPPIVLARLGATFETVNDALQRLGLSSCPTVSGSSGPAAR